MRRLIISLILVLLLAFVAIPLLADEATQEATSEATEEAPAPVVVIGDLVVDPVVSDQLETVGTNLFKLLWNAAYLPFAVPMVAVLVALSKRVFTGVSSPTLVIFWTVVIWLLFLLATQFGYENQFETAITSLATLGATFLGITLTPALAGVMYDYAKANEVAIIGYSRPVKAAVPVNSSSGERQLVPIAEIPRD
jgi:hypothetical protein